MKLSSTGFFQEPAWDKTTKIMIERCFIID